MNVALVYNLISDDMISGKVADLVAEYDSQETIDALRSALESGGHKVILLEADYDIYEKLKAHRKEIDIVFNIAEGMEGESRESFVPIICEMLGIPYTGSGPLCLAICLNKARTKEILEANGIPTPRFQLINPAFDYKIDRYLRYPVIIKLAEEGSSIGIDYDSVVSDEKQLRAKVQRLVAVHGKKNILLEEYIDGREFTIPVIENQPPLPLPIVEVIFDNVPEGKPKINLFVPDDPVLEKMQELDTEVPVNELNHSTVCPAQVDKALEKKIKDLSVKAYRALGCRDWCRMEFRMDSNNKLFLLELNPIAGIDPTYHFPKSARAMGLSYNDLILKILDAALLRYNMKEQVVEIKN